MRLETLSLARWIVPLKVVPDPVHVEVISAIVLAQSQLGTRKTARQYHLRRQNRLLERLFMKRFHNRIRLVDLCKRDEALVLLVALGRVGRTHLDWLRQAPVLEPSRHILVVHRGSQTTHLHPCRGSAS